MEYFDLNDLNDLKKKIKYYDYEVTQEMMIKLIDNIEILNKDRENAAYKEGYEDHKRGY